MRGQPYQYQLLLVGLRFVFTKKRLGQMNQQKLIADQIAENRKWLEAEWRKLGLEETTIAAGDATQQVKEPLANNRVFAHKQRPQRRS